MEDIITKTINNYENHINSGMAKLFKFMGLNTIEWEADGVIVKDINGQEYIDCLGGYGTFALGHCPQVVIDAVKRQLDLMPLSSKILFNHPQSELAEKLAQITPKDLEYSFMCNSGTEAIEGALKLARLATGRSQIIATKNSFHGKSLGSLSVTGRKVFKEPFKPLVPDIEHVPFNDIELLEQKISIDTAAVILEVIQGEGGIILADDDYLIQVKELCRNYGALLIIDEIQTGLGRTGEMFACQHYGVAPDILTVAKALGGGVMPIGAIVGTAKVWELFNQHPFIHTSTFGGNPLACAAALATLNSIEKKQLTTQAEKLGAYLLNNLNSLAKKYSEIITEVRGKGLMIGIELENEGYGGMLISELVANGILVAYTLNQQRVIRLEPPLIITKEDLDIVLKVLEKSLIKVTELAS